MNYTDLDRALALAGVVQACDLVNQVARRGIADSFAIEASISSLFQFDPDSVSEVYGGPGRLMLGLRQLREFLRGRVARDSRVTRYVVSVLHLERKLRARNDILTEVRSRLENLFPLTTHGSVIDENVIEEIAELYAQTISTLTPRILVNGEPQHLENPRNVNRIRSLLLAAVRSAVLWRQCGGSRLQIILGRKKMLDQAERLIASVHH